MPDDATQWLVAPLLVVALAVFTGCGAVVRGHAHRPPASAIGASGAAPTAAPSSPSVVPPLAPRPHVEKPDPATAARTLVGWLVHDLPPGSVSVAALDTDTGVSFGSGASSGMWMASTYKLFVLEALLAARQGSGGLSGGELADAQAAIEKSDNPAGYRLYLDAGGRSALSRLAHRLHMRHTIPWAADPTFTTTSARDCLELLRAVVGPGGALDAASREQLGDLMRNVQADERWGVGVVADPGTSFAIKNGWLGVDNTNGYGHDDDDRWIVASLGVVTVQGHQLLLAVLTQHNPSKDAGVALVERLARLTATAVRDRR